MAWTDKELKKRTSASVRTSRDPALQAAGDAGSMAALWQTIDEANQALPELLRLRPAPTMPVNNIMDAPKFIAWLVAPNGAGLGFNGEAIRYTWPESHPKVSRNFWIRCRPDGGYRLVRRVNDKAGITMVEQRFDERRVGHLLKCLVTGRRVTPRSVRKKRFWLF